MLLLDNENIMFILNQLTYTAYIIWHLVCGFYVLHYTNFIDFHYYDSIPIETTVVCIERMYFRHNMNYFNIFLLSRRWVGNLWSSINQSTFEPPTSFLFGEIVKGDMMGDILEVSCQYQQWCMGALVVEWLNEVKPGKRCVV